MQVISLLLLAAARTTVEWHYITGGATQLVTALNFSYALSSHDVVLVCFYDPRSESTKIVGDAFVAASSIVAADPGWRAERADDPAWSKWRVDTLGRAVEPHDGAVDASYLPTVLFATVDVSVDNFLMDQFAPQLTSGFQGDFDPEQGFEFGRQNFFPMVVTAFVRPPPFPVGESIAAGELFETEREALFPHEPREMEPTAWDVLSRRWTQHAMEFDGAFQATGIASFAMRFGSAEIRLRRAKALALLRARRCRRRNSAAEATAESARSAQSSVEAQRGHRSASARCHGALLDASGSARGASDFDAAHSSHPIDGTRAQVVAALRALTEGVVHAVLVGCFPPIDVVAPRDGVSVRRPGTRTFPAEEEEEEEDASDVVVVEGEEDDPAEHGGLFFEGFVFHSDEEKMQVGAEGRVAHEENGGGGRGGARIAVLTPLQEDEALHATHEANELRQLYATKRAAFTAVAGTVLAAMDSAILSSPKHCRSLHPNATAGSIVVVMPRSRATDSERSSAAAQGVHVQGTETRAMGKVAPHLSACEQISEAQPGSIAAELCVHTEHFSLLPRGVRIVDSHSCFLPLHFK